MNIFFVILIRLLGPLLILKNPLLGGALAIILDYADFSFLRAMNMNFYQDIDKLLDLYYLLLEVFVILKIKEIRKIGLGLFAYRLVGVVLFEIFQFRQYFLSSQIYLKTFIYYILLKNP
jgi:hypothetical protein